MDATQLHVSLIPGIGPVFFHALRHALGQQSWQTLYGWSVDDFREATGCTQRTAACVVNGLADKRLYDREMELMRVHGVACVGYDDDAYPAYLRHVHAPPPVLYVKGSTSHMNTRTHIAFVGSRKAGAYGRRCVRDICGDVAARGCVLVSGGAFGIDAMVHEQALAEDGFTCAVVGSGLASPYPHQHKDMFARIVASGGSVISPFSMKVSARAGNFPARNRIISGISCATVVIRAAVKSGARITARHALEQGREVGAVPGDIRDTLSAGCHELLRQGAHMVTSAEDVYVLCGGAQEYGLSNRQTAIEEQDPLVRACATPQPLDALCEEIGADATTVGQRLFDLQIEGKVTQDFLGRWSAL